MNLDALQHQPTHTDDDKVIKWAAERIFTWPLEETDNALAELVVKMIERIRLRMKFIKESHQQACSSTTTVLKLHHNT